jgi:signal transduction histidine kinase
MSGQRQNPIGITPKPNGFTLDFNMSFCLAQRRNGFYTRMVKKKKPLKALSTDIELERARTLTRMIAGFVHQFRTPLHIIASTSENLAEHSHMPKDMLPEMDLLRRSADRLHVAVSNLLAFAKGEPAEWTVGSVNEPLNKVADFLKEECRKRNVELDMRQESQLPLVRMQSVLLEEVFLNFAMNGLEAMPQGGVLGLLTQKGPDEKSIRVIIGDTGLGMDERALKRLGQAFATGKKEGAGMGVYFACEILKTHHAEPRFKSTVGEGTVVTLTFPVVA